MQCDFVDLDEELVEGEHRYRCRRCGVTRRAAAGQRLSRWCAAGGGTKPALPEALRDRGLGDTVARWLAKIGVVSRAGCGCRKRREWLNRLCPYSRAASEPPPLRFAFPHGLGDTMQLTIVLRHLRAQWPTRRIEVVGRRGGAGALAGLCDAAVERESDLFPGPPADILGWLEPEACYADSPSTKAERALRETFGIEPRLDLCRYQMPIPDSDLRLAEEYLRGHAARRGDGRFRAVAIHYQGRSFGRAKNLDESLVWELSQRVRAAGYAALVLDWDRRSGLVDREGIVDPAADPRFGEGGCEVSRLAALIERSALFVGIDSGPGHVAGATSTPTAIVWRGHHPVHYYGLSPNVTHLVPEDHARRLRGDCAAGAAFFERHYRYVRYRNLRASLLEWVSARLGP